MPITHTGVTILGPATITVFLETTVGKHQRKVELGETMIACSGHGLDENLLSYYGAKATKEAFRNLAMRAVKEAKLDDPRGMLWRATVAGGTIVGRTAEEIEAGKARYKTTYGRFYLWLERLVGRVSQFFNELLERMEPK